MEMAIYWIIIVLSIVFLWFYVGKYEWQIPAFLTKRIQRFRQKVSLENEDNCEAEAVILNIEAREFNHSDIEKEIYIIRKSRRTLETDIVMNVNLNTEKTESLEQARERSKHILEKRFPGLTVNYTEEG